MLDRVGLQGSTVVLDEDDESCSAFVPILCYSSTMGAIAVRVGGCTRYNQKGS